MSSTSAAAARPGPAPHGPAGPGLGECLRAAVLCALGALLVLAPAILGDRSTLSFHPEHPSYPAPWTAASADPPAINPITSDIDFFVLPGLLRLRQLEASGDGPWWDPNQLLGMPLGANLPFPFLDPLTWPFAGLDAVDALDWLLAFHTALAAWLAWRAVRWMGGSPRAAWLGAVGFALSAWMTTRWHLPQIAWTTAYWPGCVTVVETLRRGRRAGAVAEGAVWLGLGLVSGFPQAGVLFGVGFAWLVLSDGGLRRQRAVLGCAVASGLLGLALAAPQLQALGSVHADSARAQPESRSASASFGLSPGALWGALLPGYFGWPPDFAGDDPPAARMQDALPQRLWLQDDIQENPVENALDPGLLVLLLGLASLRRGADPRARRLAWLAVGAVGVALVWPVAVGLAPALEALGSSSVKRVIVLSACCLPLAAALELDAVARGGARRRVLGLAGGLVLALAAGVAAVALADAPDAAAWGARLGRDAVERVLWLALGVVGALNLARGRWAGWLVLASVAADLGHSAWRFNPFPPQEPAVFAETPALAWLGERDERVATLGAEWLLPPTAASLHGVRFVHGVAPLLSRRTAELLACVEGPLHDPRDPRVVRPFRDEASLEHPLLDLLQVGAVVHADPGLAARRGRPNAYESVEEGLAVLLREGVGPRAFVSGGARVVADRDERLAMLARRDRDPHATTLLERPTSTPLPPQGAWHGADVLEDRPGLARFAATTTQPALLVFTEAWAAGWQARVDGEPVELRLANHALMAVELPAGEHEVVFRHVGPVSASTRALGGMAAGLVLLLAVGSWRRHGAPSITR